MRFYDPLLASCNDLGRRLGRSRLPPPRFCFRSDTAVTAAAMAAAAMAAAATAAAAAATAAAATAAAGWLRSRRLRPGRLRAVAAAAAAWDARASTSKTPSRARDRPTATRPDSDAVPVGEPSSPAVIGGAFGARAAASAAAVSAAALGRAAPGRPAEQPVRGYLLSLFRRNSSRARLSAAVGGGIGGIGGSRRRLGFPGVASAASPEAVSAAARVRRRLPRRRVRRRRLPRLLIRSPIESVRLSRDTGRPRPLRWSWALLL